MKQTAVDYLFEKLWATPKDKFTWQSILKEANKKHKKEIIEALPGAFLNVKNVVTADKVAIKEAIKRGEFVMGARIIENFNLQIK